MAVDVTRDGCIVIDNALMVDCTRYYSTDENKPTLYRIELNIVFETEEDARRYYNALNASVQVGCVHIHLEGGLMPAVEGRTH